MILLFESLLQEFLLFWVLSNSKVKRKELKRNLQSEASTSSFRTPNTHHNQLLPEGSCQLSSFFLANGQFTSECQDHVLLAKKPPSWSTSNKCYKQQQDSKPNFGTYGSDSSSRSAGSYRYNGDLARIRHSHDNRGRRFGVAEETDGRDAGWGSSRFWGLKWAGLNVQHLIGKIREIVETSEQ